MQNRVIPLILAAAVVTFVACGDDDDTTAPVSKIVNLKATLTPANEPGTLAGNPTGSGTFTATLDTSTGKFDYTVQFSGLTSNVNNGHIHGPFIPGSTATTAGVILNFDPAGTAPVITGATFAGFKTATSGSASGSITLNSGVAFGTSATAIKGDSLTKLLLAGLTYVNIHTVSNGGGEIRGQITKTP
jgi:hypothetical protein